MSCGKWIQLIETVILAIVLAGCSTSEIPIVPITPSQKSTPTQDPTATASPMPAAVEISSFEECIDSGILVPDTFPRECIGNNEEIFREGVIFDKTYGTTNNESGRFINSTIDGGYLIAGSAKGCWVLKLDTSGETIWDASLSEELGQELQLERATFFCWLARETPVGDHVVMGTGYDANFGTFRRTFMITLDPQGKLISGVLIIEKDDKTPYLDRDGNLIWLTSLGILREARETDDGGYIIVGHFEQSSPDSHMHMFKTDKNGGYLWDRDLCWDKNIHQDWEKNIVCSYNYVRDVIQLHDGSFVIIGSHPGYWLLKTDSTGNIDWIKTLDFSGYALIQMSDGGFLIAGNRPVDQKNIDGILIKTDSVGNIQWSRNIGGKNNDGFVEIEQRPNGEIVLMGWSEDLIGEEPPYFPNKRLWLLRVESKILE
jgi:hypothetical protein